MKKAEKLFVRTIILASLFINSQAQSVQCVRPASWHEICRFADGSVTETMSTDKSFDKFDFPSGPTADRRWKEVTIDEPAQKADQAKIKAAKNAAQVKANWKAQEAKSAARNAEYEADLKKAIADKNVDELPGGGDQQAAFEKGGLSLMEKVRKATIQINCENLVEKNQPLPEYCGVK